MTSDTKISLLIGLGMVLVIGIFVSDQLGLSEPEVSPPLLRYAEPGEPLPLDNTEPASRLEQAIPQQPERTEPIRTPGEAEAALAAETIRPTPGTNVPVMVMDRTDDSTPDLSQEVVAAPSQPRITSNPSRSEARRNESSSRVLRIDERSDRPAAADRFHTVQSNETLSAISKRYYGSEKHWSDIARANPNLVGPQGRIYTGSRLAIPALATQTTTERTATPASVTNTLTRTSNEISVGENDTLTALAQRYLGDGNRWNDLYEANRDRLSNPGQIRPGMKLRLPKQVTSTRNTGSQASPATTPSTYTVRPSDTLSSIAQSKLGSASRWDEIYRLNRDDIKNPDRLVVGTRIRLPER